MEIITRSKEETEIFGAEIAKNLKGGEIFLLTGELGAGKTALIKGLAKEMGVKKTVNSPTFVIMKVYDVKNNKNSIKKFVHIDTYRNLDIGQLMELGAFEYFGKKDAVCFVEWGAGLGGYLRSHGLDYYDIKIEHLTEHERSIYLDDDFKFESEFF